jgi:hypothetical protein
VVLRHSHKTTAIEGGLMAIVVTLTAVYVGTIQSGIQVMQHLGQAGAAQAMTKLQTNLEEEVEQKVLPQWQALQCSGDVP